MSPLTAPSLANRGLLFISALRTVIYCLNLLQSETDFCVRISNETHSKLHCANPFPKPHTTTADYHHTKATSAATRAAESPSLAWVQWATVGGCPTPASIRATGRRVALTPSARAGRWPNRHQFSVLREFLRECFCLHFWSITDYCWGIAHCSRSIAHSQARNSKPIDIANYLGCSHANLSYA